MDVRRADANDREAMYRICLLTGLAGEDASAVHDDPDLLGHVYVGPYLAHEPELAFVAVDDVGVVGYALGAVDVHSFARELERSWWPPLRARYPLGFDRRPADRALVELIHRPPVPPPVSNAGFPSELHVDLLPRAQGKGMGRRLMSTLLAALSAAGSPGVHLGVDPRNTRAVGFYERLGFRRAAPSPGVEWFTRALG